MQLFLFKDMNWIIVILVALPFLVLAGVVFGFCLGANYVTSRFLAEKKTKPLTSVRVDSTPTTEPPVSTTPKETVVLAAGERFEQDEQGNVYLVKPKKRPPDNKKPTNGGQYTPLVQIPDKPPRKKSQKLPPQ